MFVCVCLFVYLFVCLNAIVWVCVFSLRYCLCVYVFVRVVVCVLLCVLGYLSLRFSSLCSSPGLWLSPGTMLTTINAGLPFVPDHREGGRRGKKRRGGGRRSRKKKKGTPQRPNPKSSPVQMAIHDMRPQKEKNKTIREVPTLPVVHPTQI